jgi:hypothetical protein
MNQLEPDKSNTTFVCVSCDFVTSRKSHYKRHLKTAKHCLRVGETIESKNNPKNLHCECGILFNSRSSLWRHKKVCTIDDVDNELGLTDKEIITALLQQNEKLMKVIENGVTNNNSHNNNNNNNNNSHNKTFNMNVFLNETCKDAMNINEFVSSIKVNLDDLEHTGRQGYIQGITNIVVKNLNNLEQCLRPLHCSDLKREIMYIKNNNEWTKETDSKPILTKAIKIIANENIKQIKNWQTKHPDCMAADSKHNNLYLKIVSNSMNGFTEEEGQQNINKIISNVAKEVIIDKYIL